jgi:Tetratricopeptide repeat
MAKEMSPVFMIQAKKLFDVGKFSAAIMTLQEGLKQYPQFMSARVLLGEVHWTAGEVALARTELEYVINSVPDNFAAHRKLALIYRAAGEVQLAMKSCRSVLQANPRDLEMRTLLDQLQELPLPTLQDVPPQSVLRPDHLEMASASEPAMMAPRESENIDSETLAELYILQGYHDKGLLVYHRLAAKYPQNKQYRERIEALEHPVALEATLPSESGAVALSLPQEALAMEKEVSLGGLPGGPGETGEEVGPTGEKPVSAGLGRAGEVRLRGGPGEPGKGSVSADPGREGEIEQEVRPTGEKPVSAGLGWAGEVRLRGGLGEMAQRKNHVRRLEGWLQVIRARRRL